MTPEQLGPYRIVRPLGRGGMGRVYEGVNTETDEPAAIKILAGGLAQEPDFRQRFEGEIETLRKLYHPNIVQLFGFGEEGDWLFYAMELVDGSSLEEELRRGRRFDWREVAEIGITTCRALRHAHDRGVIHRDIKPANLLLTKEGRVKLSDFGIARLFGNTRITATGNVLGTAEYMAPEQAEGRPVTPRTDLYSLGGVLYCLLAGRPPFRAKSLVEMLEKHRKASPEPISRHATDVPAELEQIILQLLEKDPDKRIANATLVARRLEAMVAALSVKPDTEEREALRELAEQGEGLRLPGPAGPNGGGAPPQPHSGDASQGVPPERTEVSVADNASSIPPGQTSTHVLGDPLKPFGRTGTQLPGDWAGKPTLQAEPGLASDDLPETKATGAFAEYEVAGEAPSRSPTPAAAPGNRTKTGRFTAVGADELDAIGPAAPAHHVLISVQTWVLLGSLIGVALTAWYSLRPPSADALYRRISAKTQDKSIDSLLEAERSIEEFLTRYANDPRSAELRGLMREIELYSLERQFDLRARSMANVTQLLPIERAYVEAINYASIDPERGLAKLQALVELYSDRTDLSGPAGKCLELVRRRYERLSQQFAAASEDSREELEGRLRRAEEIRQENPDAARAILKGLIELYQDKPWAAEAVAQARAALDAEGKSPPPDAHPEPKSAPASHEPKPRLSSPER